MNWWLSKKNHTRLPLRSRLMLLTLVPMMVTITVVLGLDYQSRGQIAKRALEDRALAVISALDHDIAHLSFESRERTRILDINERLQAFPFIERLIVYTVDGDVVTVYQKPAWSKHPFPPAPSVHGTHTSNGHLIISSRVGGLATVLVQANQNSVSTARAAALKANVALGLLLTLVGIVVVLRLQRTLTERFLTLEHTANEVVRTQDFTLRADDFQQDELDHIAAALNNLLSTIETTLQSLHERDEHLRQEMEERALAEDQKRTFEQQLHQSQKMDSLGRLAGGIAHDFNNLLAAIMGQAELIEHQNPGTGASLIVDASVRAAELTEQLLSFNQEAAVELEYVDLHKVLDELQALMGRVIPSHITFHVNLSLDLWGVHADEGRLQQVLLNLAINAKDAMPNGGELFISADNQTRESDEGSQEFVEIIFRDTGHGMDAETLRQAMEPFFTTKGQDGTGLGLSVAHGIVEQFRGTLSIESTPEEGTSAIVHLLRGKGDEHTATARQDWRCASTTSSTILVVEDSEPLREVTASILETLGHRILTANSVGEAAVHFTAGHSDCDLVITDMVMPNGSGLDLIRQLRVDHPTLPVILFSGFANEGDVEMLSDDPYFHFIAKPYKAATLLSLVQSFLDPEQAKQTV